MTQLKKTIRLLAVVGIGVAIAIVGLIAEAATSMVVSAIFDTQW